MADLSIVVLTEVALGDDDARRILALHAEAAPAYHVLVPADTNRNLLADVLDHLSLLELRQALDAVRGDHEDDPPAESAQELAGSLAALRSYGAEATGEVVEGDPVAALMRVTGGEEGFEVIVVTRPHAVEDTFHRDWASRARDALGIPVLHVYAGTSWVG